MHAEKLDLSSLPYWQWKILKRVVIKLMFHQNKFFRFTYRWEWPHTIWRAL